MNDGKIQININKPMNGELTAQDESIPQVEAKGVEKTNVAKQAINAALINAGKQAIQQGFNSYVEISGDYNLQRNVNLGTNIAADVLIIAKGGPVGAIAVTTKYALNAANTYVAVKKQNQQTEYNKKLMGQISREGSRYW